MTPSRFLSYLALSINYIYGGIIMNYADIKYCDIANGIGVRTSLFVSGCNIHCKDCFNKEVQDFNYGHPFTKEVEDEIINSLKEKYIHGLTVLGGEPFEPANQGGVLKLLMRVVNECPDKSIWVFTGYELDKDILNEKSKIYTPYTEMLLTCIDVLVDGPFIAEKKDISLKFRGSSNQRIINIPKTLELNKIVLMDEFMKERNAK